MAHLPRTTNTPGHPPVAVTSVTSPRDLAHTRATRIITRSAKFISPSLYHSESACRRQHSDRRFRPCRKGPAFPPLSPPHTGINSLQICLHNERERCSAPVAARGSPNLALPPPPDLPRTVPVCAFKSAAFIGRSRL